MTEDEAPLEIQDAEDRAEVKQTEAIVMRVLADSRPASATELRERVRQELGDVDSSIIRAALLRVLNTNRADATRGQKLPAPT